MWDKGWKEEMHLLKRLIPSLLLAGLTYGQQPTVSNISIDALSTSSFRVFFDVTGVPGAWAEIFYGVQSGVYPYNTRTINCYETVIPCGTTGTTAFTLSGLKPGTTYYVRPTARPNRDNDLDMCQTPACGAEEIAVTTLSGPQPMAPTSPQEWKPQPPDTSGYSVVPLEVGTTGECWAAQTVVSPDGWTVASHTYLGAAMEIVGYGTVFEIPQGVSCKVPVGGSNDPTVGYFLPSKALDNQCGGTCGITDPNHRWIVFRTKELTSADFPPFGARVTPDFAPVLGKFSTSQPNQFTQFFNANHSAARVHHIWFQNLEFKIDDAYVNPTDHVDPVAFTYFMNLGSTYQTQNNQFIVLDRLYMHCPGPPIRCTQGLEIGGNYQAMIGTWLSGIENWRMTEWPSTAGTLSSGDTVLNIPKNNFRFAKGSPQLGMTGSATASLSSITQAGTVVGNLFKDHLEVQYTAGIGTLICSGCTASAVATPATPPTALRLFAGNVTAGGQFAGISWNNQEYQSSRYIMSFGILTSDLQAAGGPYLLDNNYFDGVGEGFYMDAQSSIHANDDLTFTHNHEIWPKHNYIKDANNQWRYNVRQHWETKRLHRALLKGNLFSYSWGYQNDGPAIFLSARPTYQTTPGTNDGISDIKIESNIISHLRSGIECQSASPADNGGNDPDPRALARVEIRNNLMFDLGRWLYCDTINCPSLGSFYFHNRPGCQDLVIENNTMDKTYGEIPAIFYLGGGAQYSNYLSFRKNVVYLSNGLAGYGGGSFGDWPGNGVLNHDVRPSINYSNTGASPNFRANLDATFVNIGETVTPNYSWGQNVIIGGWRDTNQTLMGAVDMSFSEVQTYANKMPPGDTYPTGNNILARETTLKFTNPAQFDFRIAAASAFSPGGIGVDFEKLYVDMGMVTAFEKPAVSASAAQFIYTAPDQRACAVDVRGSGSWQRVMDGGGKRRRTVQVTGLTAQTVYDYRVICYYKQMNDGVLYTDYRPDQITDGTFTTTDSQVVTVPVPFSLSAVPGATQIRVTLTPVTGSAVVQTCTVSPCLVPVPQGDYTSLTEYLNGQGKVLAPGTGKRSAR